MDNASSAVTVGPDNDFEIMCQPVIDRPMGESDRSPSPHGEREWIGGNTKGGYAFVFSV
jgi:hypothetical protein